MNFHFLILQNTRTRIFKTDYISCPSCGRTKFDLQETTALVKEHTNHLKGLKISVWAVLSMDLEKWQMRTMVM